MSRAALHKETLVQQRSTCRKLKQTTWSVKLPGIIGSLSQLAVGQSTYRSQLHLLIYSLAAPDPCTGTKLGQAAGNLSTMRQGMGSQVKAVPSKGQRSCTNNQSPGCTLLPRREACLANGLPSTSARMPQISTALPCCRTAKFRLAATHSHIAGSRKRWLHLYRS